MHKNKDDKFEDLLLVFLRAARDKEGINPKNPITADEICRRWNAKFSDNKTSVQVREAVNSLRTRGEPIGSTSTDPAGYAYCLTVEEYKDMNEHLLTRATKIWRAYNNPIKQFLSNATASLFPDSTPLTPEEQEEIRKKSEGTMNQASAFN